jgi:putative nucleotidyltransferase with HDIG domain
MNTLELSQVVKNVRDLPALPSVVLDLISTFEREDVDVATLADKISTDQALAAKTLRLANSSFYGLPAKVKTVKQAIVVLGFDSARALAVAGGIIDGFAVGKPGHIDVAAFWRHSVAVALCAKNVARCCHLGPDDAFIAGLLHDIGRLVLAACFPEPYEQVDACCAEQDVTLSEAEQRVLGVDHQRTGQLLAEVWRFPPQIQRAIGQHHAPSCDDLGNLAGLVHVSNAIVHALDLGGGAHATVPRLQDAAWDSLGLAPDQLKAVFRQTEAQFAEACRILLRDSDHE